MVSGEAVTRHLVEHELATYSIHMYKPDIHTTPNPLTSKGPASCPVTCRLLLADRQRLSLRCDVRAQTWISQGERIVPCHRGFSIRMCQALAWGTPPTRVQNANLDGFGDSERDTDDVSHEWDNSDSMGGLF